MNPFFFGSSKKPLFGIYHPPQSRAAKERAVLICQPLGHEYVRAHRAVRQLALLLSKAGAHALRFDYYGTGDSGGEGDEGGLAQWTQDIGTAIDELKDVSGASRVSIVGVRAGALLAVLAVSRRRDVDAVLLWDPVIDGAGYAALMDEMNRQWLGSEYPRVPNGDLETSRVGALGFHFTPAMRRELEQANLLSLEDFSGKRLSMIVSTEDPEHRALRARLDELRVAHDYACVPGGGDWARRERITATILPHQVSGLLQGIVGALA